MIPLPNINLPYNCLLSTNTIWTTLKSLYIIKPNVCYTVIQENACENLINYTLCTVDFFKALANINISE